MKIATSYSDRITILVCLLSGVLSLSAPLAIGAQSTGEAEDRLVDLYYQSALRPASH